MTTTGVVGFPGQLTWGGGEEDRDIPEYLVVRDYGRTVPLLVVCRARYFVP